MAKPDATWGGYGKTVHAEDGLKYAEEGDDAHQGKARIDENVNAPSRRSRARILEGRQQDRVHGLGQRQEHDERDNGKGGHNGAHNPDDNV
jgi:hypothetical protein